MAQLNCAACGEKAGFETLDGLCSMCFQTLVIYPLALARDAAQRAWEDAIDRRYHVEVALGLRPSPMQSSDFEKPASAGAKPRIRKEAEDEEVGI